MGPLALFAALLSLPLSTTLPFPADVAPAPSYALVPRAVAYYSPVVNGGSMLTNSSEPLNVIISGESSLEVLTSSGILAYLHLSFTTECLGIHLGDAQTANLGDGNGYVAQTDELREDYSFGGSCFETFVGESRAEMRACYRSSSQWSLTVGYVYSPPLVPLSFHCCVTIQGNHLRTYHQDGCQADSGAWFLAVSVEKGLPQSHTIAPNGYDLGRDYLVGNATQGSSNSGTFYTATVESISGLLPSGSAGINHGIAIDGIVKLLTVTVA